jgi:hypothetical protein
MATHYPRNFGAMLNAFLNGWKPNEEAIDFQHMGKKLDPETGRKITIHGQWTPVRSLKELIASAQSWPITDNYITGQRFAKWDTEPYKDGTTERVIRSDHEAYRLDRVYTDTDPEDGRADCLDWLPRYKRMQDELEVDGKTPVWINCSGRGYHSYTYLDRIVSWRNGQILQDVLGYVFNLELDFWTPISRARMLRLPYSKNSRTGTWVLCVGRNMTLGGLRNAMKSSLEGDGCHWDNPIRVPPEHILKLHPGQKVLDEYREKKREKARAKIRRGMEKKAREAVLLLNGGKNWSEVVKLMGYHDERYLRYWVNEFSGKTRANE